jgi:hypothetical protein
MLLYLNHLLFLAAFFDPNTSLGATGDGLYLASFADRAKK